MIFKDGDKVVLDGEEMEVTNAPPDGYWLKSNNNSYYYMQYKTLKELDELHRVGRLKIGRKTELKGGNENCSHWNMKKYVGVREVYRYCTTCGAKEYVDWRLIKDEKDY